MVACLGLAACSAKRGSPQVRRSPQELGSPQVPASRYTEADSAAVLEAAVHEILIFDEARAAVKRKFSAGPAKPPGEPRVFVRIWVPEGAWETAIVARLR